MSRIVSPTRISISNAQFYGYHGVRTEEQAIGGQFQVDLDVLYDATGAILKDDVNISVNYEELLFCISEIMNNESYNLIETVANEILVAIFEKFEIIIEATVRVRKLNVPIRTILDYVETEQTMQRA